MEGGHAKVVLDVIFTMQNSNSGISLGGFFDDQLSARINGLVRIGSMKDAECTEEYRHRQAYHFVIAIGNNKIRHSLGESMQLHWLTVIHSSAVVSISSNIGKGTAIMPTAVINAEARIGKHVIINTGAIVEHDCQVSDYAHISPRATLCGGVSVGIGTQVGAGAVVLPGVSIGDWCMIGAGAVVTRNVADSTTVKGIPAR